jgi:hypothetical protein
MKSVEAARPLRGGRADGSQIHAAQKPHQRAD